jgi:hypothetical protein
MTWTCDFCRYWERVGANVGLCLRRNPPEGNLEPPNEPACVLFINRFDIDPPTERKPS